MAQRHEESTAEEHHTWHRHSPLRHIGLRIQRASGGWQHRGLANRPPKKLRPLLLAAMIALSITVVGLHVVGGLVLLKTGLSGISLQGPLAYIVIGLSIVVAVLRLKHVWGVTHRNRKRADAGED